MSTYNNNRFTPGNKANMKSFMNKQFIRQYYNTFLTTQSFDNINSGDQISQDYLCSCIQQKANNIKQGWNTPGETQNKRVAQILTGTLGGKTTFGNANKPVTVNYLGGWEGQPGGLPRPLRNKF